VSAMDCSTLLMNSVIIALIRLVVKMILLGIIMMTMMNIGSKIKEKEVFE